MYSRGCLFPPLYKFPVTIEVEIGHLARKNGAARVKNSIFYESCGCSQTMLLGILHSFFCGALGGTANMERDYPALVVKPQIAQPHNNFLPGNVLFEI
jgi:hypothetical protein